MSTTTKTIADFLLARIAEDEAAAGLVQRQQGDHPQPDEGYLWHDEYDLLYVAPARVLAECAAKRQIIEFCRVPMVWVGRSGTYLNPGPEDFVPGGGDPHNNYVLRLMVQPYADHEEFDATWRLL